MTYFKLKETDSSDIGSFKFSNLLFELGISRDKNEKLNIKINYTTPKIKPTTEIAILKRFGFLQPVITNTKNYLLAQKIRAALTRKNSQPRDFYDIVWLLSYRVKSILEIFSEMQLKNTEELFKKLLEVYRKNIQPNLVEFKKRLKPFLIDEKKVNYLDIFEKTLKELI
jgi:hypothetical protein